MTNFENLPLELWMDLLRKVPSFWIPVMSWVSKSINLIVLQLIWTSDFPPLNRMTFLKDVIKEWDSVSLMKWGCDIGCFLDGRDISTIARYGRTEICKWVMTKNRQIYDYGTLDTAARYGQSEIITILS